MKRNIQSLAFSRIHTVCFNQNSKSNCRFFSARTKSERIMAQNEDSSLEKAKSELKRIYDAGVQAVMPSKIIDNSVNVIGNELRISGGKIYNLTGNVYVVGFGKAVASMATALEKKLGSHLKRGIVSVPRGSKDKFRESGDTNSTISKITGTIDYRESSVDNQPDSETLLNTLEIVNLVENLNENDTLIVLISGGGSALLFMPKATIQPDVKLEFCKKLQNSGADIRELNIVRKKLSMVKGGGLARMAHPARVIALILSDIVDDPVDLIASGPTIYSKNLAEDVATILKKYNLYKEIDGDLKASLTSKEKDDDEALLNGGKDFEHVDNFVIGNNALAIEASSQECLRIGLSPIRLRKDIVGRVEEVSEAYAKVTGLVCRAWSNDIDRKIFIESIKDHSVIYLSDKKVDEIFHVIESSSGGGIVLIGGGEPTVVVKGSGKGGRNQELALRFSLDWLEIIRKDSRLAEFEVTFLSAGTDGQDGPTDAAGAFGYPAIGPTVDVLLKKLQKLCNEENIAEGTNKQFATDSDLNSCRKDEKVNSYRSMLREAEKILPLNALANNDSYNFYSRFKRGKDLLKTGLSGTNVMDLHFVLVKKKRCDCRIDFAREEKCPDSIEHDLHTDFQDPSIETKRDQGNEKRRELLNLKILDSALTDSCCGSV